MALGSILETRRTLRLIDQRLRIARAVHMRRVQSDHAAPNVESTAYRNTWLKFTPVDNVERDANDVAFKRACMARRDALSCRAGAKKIMPQQSRRRFLKSATALGIAGAAQTVAAANYAGAQAASAANDRSYW